MNGCEWFVLPVLSYYLVDPINITEIARIAITTDKIHRNTNNPLSTEALFYLLGPKPLKIIVATVWGGEGQSYPTVLSISKANIGAALGYDTCRGPLTDVGWFL